MRTSATDGAVCQWHTFSADRSGDDTNTAFADSDRQNIKLFLHSSSPAKTNQTNQNQREETACCIHVKTEFVF